MVSRFSALIIASFILVGGCTTVRLPAWHHTVVFVDPDQVQGSLVRSCETPVTMAPARTAPGRWSVRTPPVTSGRFDGFDEALISWNVDLPPGAAATIDVIVPSDSVSAPAGPLRVGFAGDGRRVAPGDRLLESAEHSARIDVDYLRSVAPLRTLEVRVELLAPEGWSAEDPPGRVERLSICLSRTLKRTTRRPDEVIGSSGRSQCTNRVPFRPQTTDDPTLAGRLCSPASLSMVLAFHGVECPLGDLAARVRDPDEDIYGNWPRNIQAAYELGVPGFLARFNCWDSVADHLSRGQPIIASIRAPRGVLRDAPYRELNGGHLIVLTGLDGRGGVLVNDPAAGTAALGQRVYSMRDLTKAWMELGNGTAYVLLNPAAHAPASRRSLP